jgi:hypothetical protein
VWKEESVDSLKVLLPCFPEGIQANKENLTQYGQFCNLFEAGIVRKSSRVLSATIPILEIF